MRECLKKINPYFTFILLLSLLFIFYNSWAGSLVNSDDAIYAQIIKQIASTGNWFDLQWKSFDYTNKPPLFFWLGAFSVKIFSLNEFSLRFPAALSGLLTVLILFMFAKRHYCSQGSLIAGMLLLSFTLFLNLSHRVMVDLPLLLFSSLSILAFDMAREKRKYFYVAWLALGLALLLKGVAAVPIVVTVLIYYLLTNNIKILLAKESVLGFLSMVAIAAPWKIYRVTKSGEGFANAFTKSQALSHYVGRGLDIYEKPFYYYLKQFIAIDFKICLVLALSIVLLIAYFKQCKSKLLLLSTVWIFIYFFAFSFSKTKLDHYIIGVYPPIALFVGLTVSSIEIKKKGIIKLIIALIVFIIALSNFIPYTNSREWLVDSSGPLKRLTLRYNDLAGEADILYLYKIYLASPSFYAKSKVVELEPGKKQFDIVNGIDEFKYTNSVLFIPKDSLVDLMNLNENFFCIMKLKDYEKLKVDLKTLHVVEKDSTYLLISKRLESS